MLNDVLLIIVMAIILLLGLVFIPQLLIGRAVPHVIRIFRQKNAVGVKNARFIDELGLKPQGFFDKMLKPRDYKPMAMQLLVKVNVIRVTDDGKLYLSEPDLALTKWNKL